jgi:hypothetical protein
MRLCNLNKLKVRMSDMKYNDAAFLYVIFTF